MKFNIQQNNFKKTFCMSCGKEKNLYKTVQEANNHLQFLDSDNHVYYCDSCHGYHTASKQSGGNNVLRILDELKRQGKL